MTSGILIIPLYIKYMCFHNVPGTRDIVINTKFLGSKNLSFQVAIIATDENREEEVNEASLEKKKKQARLGGDAFQDEGTVKTMALSESSTLTDERKSKKAGMA